MPVRTALNRLIPAFLAVSIVWSQAAVAAEPVVRISQGFFAPAQLREVRAKLEAGRASLDPALRALPGLLHYYVAIDAQANSIVNVSVWESLAAAEQMNDLEAMRVQRDVFVQLGVEFQPIRHYTGLWSVAP
ncbi:MAG TPA: antibiotic biosynthesis monooxygenase [Pseudomonadales bacterium]